MRIAIAFRKIAREHAESRQENSFLLSGWPMIPRFPSCFGIHRLILIGLALAHPGWKAELHAQGKAVDHWSVQPRTRPKVPTPSQVSGQEWIRNPVDAF